MNLNQHIRDIPDFPKPGIIFKDITPLLKQPKAMAYIEDEFARRLEGSNLDAIVGIESRGFIFGVALARRLNLPFVPVRKVGKLPHKAIQETYALEYGEACIEIHEDACAKGERVVVVDDLLATGGTAVAACKLLERLGAKVEALAFVIELSFLPGRAALEGHRIECLLDYNGE
ncbi:MAG: adenine phosphoribosyltransferase [Candidatus Eisenbacteria bacterium]|uniref:Adenine phosphoribosyltransferase n=1 Tax=Eiseniibacteriota bacterium TaxID=2212470 RepID=A0A7Y2H2G8_UNCEI|nr:adenine phosphoribosyltransferase [Candidatus Eisenbacteria bacterium]